MDLTKLSNFQLYSLIQNNTLDASIQTAANRELDSRTLPLDELAEIVHRHDLQYRPEPDKGLALSNKLFLILVPAVFTIQILLASKYL